MNQALIDAYCNAVRLQTKDTRAMKRRKPVNFALLMAKLERAFLLDDLKALEMYIKALR